MKNSQNEEMEMNVTLWRVMTFVMAQTVVRVDVLLKWKLASWKVKGMVFVHPLPESLDEIKDRIECNCQCHCFPFAESFVNLQRRLAITIKNRERHFEYVGFWFFFLFFFFVDDKFSIKIQILFEHKAIFFMTFTNSKTIQTKTKVFIHLNLIVFDIFFIKIWSLWL